MGADDEARNIADHVAAMAEPLPDIDEAKCAAGFDRFGATRRLPRGSQPAGADAKGDETGPSGL